MKCGAPRFSPAVRARDYEAIAVAGTATSLAAIDQRLEPYDREAVEGYVIARRACERMLDELAAVPLERRRRVVGLHPARAPTIVACAAYDAATGGNLIAYGNLTSAQTVNSGAPVGFAAGALQLTLA